MYVFFCIKLYSSVLAGPAPLWGPVREPLSGQGWQMEGGVEKGWTRGAAALAAAPGSEDEPTANGTGSF